MANAYSVLHNYDTPVFTPNYQLIATAMQYKQNKIDANRQRLQTLYDKLAIVDVAKDQDKEYVERRLQTAKSIANKYASLDLSSNNLTNQLVSKLTDVVDDNVKNAVLSTRIYRSEQAAWDKLREEKPDKYNEANHAYAMQGANAWLNDGKTGSKYKGGGDVIEYVDLSEKIMKNLPNLQKALKAEWIQTGPKQGYFRSMDTYEAVPRDKMEEALSFVFNAKDKQQMGINAWAQYDRMDEAQLREAYDGYFAPRLNQLNERLNAVDLAIGKAQTEAEKNELRKLKTQLNKAKEAHQNNSFDNVAGTYGKQAAYNRLYQEQYYNSILDTYSYGPRLIERKVDEIDKANKEYELKLREEQRAIEKEQFDRDMKIAEFELKKKEFDLKYPGAKTPIVKGKALNVDTPEARGDEINRAFAEEAEARAAVTDILKNNGVSAEDLTDSNFIASLDNVASTGVIKVGDKEIELTDEELTKVLSYKNKVYQNSAAIKESIATLESMFDGISSQIGAAVYLEKSGTGKTDFDSKNSIPEFNFYIKDGKVVPTKKGSHFARDLYGKTVKGNLTADEKLTLDLYNAIWSLNDPATTESSRKVIQKYIGNRLANLSRDEAKKISTEVRYGAGKNMPNTYGTINYMQDYYLSEITAGDMEFSARNFTKVSEEEKDFIRELQTKLHNSEAPYRILTDIEPRINENIAKTLSKTAKMPYLNQAVVRPGSAEHTSLRTLLQVPEDLKSDIYIEKQFDAQGLPTDQNKVYYKTKSTKDGVTTYTESTPVMISDKEMEESGVAAFDTQRYEYDARLGDLAPTLNLGNNIYSKKVRDKRIINGQPEMYLATDGNWAQKVITDARNRLQDENAVEVVSRNIQAYRKGDFSFQLKPINGIYQMEMTDAYGNSLHTWIPEDASGQKLTELAPNQVAQLVREPREFIELTFMDYINQLEEDLFTGKADAGQIVTVGNMMNPYNIINPASSQMMEKSYRPGY